MMAFTGCGRTETSETESVAEVVTAEGIDYLSTEGIQLEPGTEIAMIGTDAGNIFYDVVKQGAEQAITDLNTALGYSGKNKLSFTFASPKEENVVDQINIIDQFLDKAPDVL